MCCFCLHSPENNNNDKIYFIVEFKEIQYHKNIFISIQYCSYRYTIPFILHKCI